MMDGGDYFLLFEICAISGFWGWRMVKHVIVTMGTAQRRGHHLFRRLMTEEQRATWDKHGYCAVWEPRQKLDYLIMRDRQHGIVCVFPEARLNTRLSIYQRWRTGQGLEHAETKPLADEWIAYLLNIRAGNMISSCYRPLRPHSKAARAVKHYRQYGGKK